ncbi:hypothetical protein AB1Y20_014936 [Prymnesium parvum]|uniref:Transcription factor CBF/NF-Y/archaeal histone domain-containing protein n=1 Tax=Prymnesium parvum TaxID=97485 RepID=A0AB34JZW3_PRYPA|mmetsp:Transcript_27147/g.67289  ORF Transcript_27147/g.67289 Transcript_27147/m.67289 type:complete len:165 (+) Transcript_27147:53-547(+)|eukprot:CAMPEP_0182817940 /NCGR_PEP_ID=MMETSP0006_2-20121128/11748_1 /TAXON_ID=97485 /ORGANISM="Prymnesium parvum, Strain Texoma1" /LENGTH=164 /DNA_ID=CAMNT_0024944351 /DNA_START=47 /DNA_END=541 /DNA_ORIENTATION=+
MTDWLTAYAHQISSDADAGELALLKDDVRLQEMLTAAKEAFLENMRVKWAKMAEGDDDAHRKLNKLPLARIKKIMKQDACCNLRQIGSTASESLSSCSQLLIGLLTTLSWVFAKLLGHLALGVRDVAASIEAFEQFDFLADICRDVATFEATALEGGNAGHGSS